MRHVELKSYCFEQPHQWRAGVADQLQVSEKGLAAPAQMRLTPWIGTGPEDNTQALAYDPCGELHWVRKRKGTFELVRALRGGTLVVGHLSLDRRAEDWHPSDLALGTDQIWLLARSQKGEVSQRVFRYYSNNLQRLAGVDFERAVLALCSDGGDGAWILLGGDGQNAKLAHLDPSGEQLATVPLPTPLSTAAVAVTGEGASVVVLDAKPFVEPCDIPLQWRLWVVNVREKEPKARFVFSLPEKDSACGRGYPAFCADRLAIDCADRIRVLASASGELWTLSLQGEVSAQNPGTMPTIWLPINALAAREDLVVSGGGGVAGLSAVPDAVPDSISTYITPTMVSPDGAQRGWMRADLDVNMEQSTAVEVSVAATRDNDLVGVVDKLLSKESLPPSTRLSLIDGRLPWSEERTKIYRGGQLPAGRPLRYPLHEIDATHIWLRVRIHAMAGAKAPRLNALRVLYPNISYTQYLPAVYQENKAAAKFLRRLMVIFESLFGDLDTELAELPRRIAPKTAPEDWLPFLLRWLGLPSPTELDPKTQRRLLTSAPDLLRDRGTMTALEGILRILVGEEFSVTDNGAGPAPWTLPRHGRARQGPRLGCDTLILAQRQPGFRLGCSARLGEQALGHTALDPVDLFAKRNSGIEIRIAADMARRERLQPLLQRYLPYFIPAHCHYRLRFVPKDRLSKTWMLGEVRLQSETVSRLGSARLGQAPLPESTSEGVVLDRSSFQDSGSYLV